VVATKCTRFIACCWFCTLYRPLLFCNRKCEREMLRLLVIKQHCTVLYDTTRFVAGGSGSCSIVLGGCVG